MQSQYAKDLMAAWQTRRAAVEKLDQARALITKAAGFDHYDLKKKNLTFETSFEKVKGNLRYDVEFYQPIHDEMESIMEESNCVKAADVAEINEMKIDPTEYPKSVFRYVDIDTVDTEIGDYEAASILGYEAPDRARRKPQNGDIILSTVRPNRNAVAMMNDNCDNLVVSTGFAVVTPTEIEPSVLFAILKTEPIFMQIVRKARNAMYPAVRANSADILDIFIPELSTNVHQVKDAITQSITLLQQSNLLLEQLLKSAEMTLQELACNFRNQN
jgi:hypothetical protein